MKGVEGASEAMDDQAGLNQHVRLQDIRQVTWQSKDHFDRHGPQWLTSIAARSQLSNVERCTEELKVLALEARNHLYAVFRDTEAWQEVVQSLSL